MALTFESIAALEYVSHVDVEQLGNQNLYAVISGCTVTESVSDMVVTVAAGVALVNGVIVTVAGNTITLVNDATNKRWNYATINSSGTAVVVLGTAAASAAVEPTKPDPGGRTILKMYKVEANQSIASDIAVAPDKRIIAPQGTQNGGTIASAGALPVTHQYHVVSGTTTITSLPSFTAGIIVTLTFSGACPITHNGTSLILLGGGSTTTTANDTLMFISLGSGNWRQIVGPSMSVMPPIITPYSKESIGSMMAAAAIAVAASTAWPSANAAIYVPFVVTQTITVKRMFTSNGLTAAGNIDIGIYKEDGTRVVSMGPTAMSGTNVVQTFNVADTVLTPGRYYLALVGSDGTATFYSSSLGSVTRAATHGILLQAAAGTLPATATFATNDTFISVPMFGFTIESVF